MLVHHRNTPLTAVGITRWHRPTEAYSQVRNDFHRHPGHTLRAYRVAGYILSHADGFTQTQKQIARACGLSLTTVRAALEDLREERYLVSRRVREAGRWVGTAYAISDIPFTNEELAALCPPEPDSEHSHSEHSESAHPKKINASKKTTTPEKTNPSGGATADADGPNLEVPSPDGQEKPVVQPAAQDALFDVPAPEKARKAESPSARTVVAAFVESYREHHSGGDPVKSAIGRVARAAKAILSAGTAAPEELTEAARAMGAGPFNNLDVALSIHRQGGRKRKGFTPGTPARPYTDPDWQQVAVDVEREWYERLLVDDEAVRWALQDPSEVERLVAAHPELDARFRDVA